jgi:hypothetical protein
LLLGLSEAGSDSLFRVGWKSLLLDYKLVEAITKVVGTGTAAMAIIDGEERTPRPLGVREGFSLRGLKNVQND